jgi:hypothetical protein
MNAKSLHFSWHEDGWAFHPPNTSRCVSIASKMAGGTGLAACISERQAEPPGRGKSRCGKLGVYWSLRVLKRGKASDPLFGDDGDFLGDAVKVRIRGSSVRIRSRENRVNQSGSVALSAEVMRGPPQRK